MTQLRGRAIIAISPLDIQPADRPASVDLNQWAPEARPASQQFRWQFKQLEIDQGGSAEPR
jgi:hypothetical protein